MLTGVPELTDAEEDIIRRYGAYVFYKPHGHTDLLEKLDLLTHPRPGIGSQQSLVCPE